MDAPSSHVDWSAGAVELLTQQTAWPESDRPRRAAVSSFGISGTNAHVVLEQPEPVEATDGQAEPAVEPGVVPWVLSGKTVPALRDQAARLLTHLTARGEEDLVDIGLSLATERSGFTHRAVVLATDRDAALRALSALAAGEPDAGVVEGPAGSGRSAFLFSGQGSQRVGMGRELYGRFPVFADAFDAVCAGLDEHLDSPLREVVWGEDADLLNRTVYAQAGLFAVEVALFRLVESWGVRPDFVAGHSIGEVAAAHVAGVFSLADACALVSARGRLMQALPAGGAMVALQAAEDEVQPHLTDAVSIAAVNGPTSVVISGAENAVEAVRAHFEAQGRKTTRLRVSHAFHSPLMDPMLEDFRAVLEGLSYASPNIPVVSNLTGEQATDEQLCTAEYWVRHVREAVRFADGVRTLQAEGVTRFLELGPDGVLTAMAQESVTDEAAVLVPVLRRNRDEAPALLTALAQLYAHGAKVRWSAAYAGTGARSVDLPTYAFQHQRFWPAGSAMRAGDVRFAGLGSAEHPMLGAAVELVNTDGYLFTGRLSVQSHPWLADHVVMGSVLVPGTALLELAIRAGDETGCGAVEELTLAAPLVLPEQGGVQVQVWVGEPDDAGRRALTIHSRPDNAQAQQPWTLHAQGTLAAEAAAVAFDAAVWPPEGAEPVDVSDCYERFADAGFEYGPVFQGLRAAWRLGEDVFAEVGLPDGVDGGAFGLHPALFDASLHASAFGGDDDQEGGGVPFSWSGVSLHAAGASAVRVRLSRGGDGAVSIALADTAGAPVASVESLMVRPISAEQLNAADHDALFKVDWTTVQLNAMAAATESLAVVGPDPLGLAGALAADGTADRTTDGTADRTAVFADFASLSAAADVPELVLVPSTGGIAGSDDTAGSVHALTSRVLDQVKSWLADERFAASRLVFVTRGATTGEDLPGAAAWGLVRSAQAENPGRFGLVDLDGGDGTSAVLPKALALDEPQLAIRGGEALAPRLARVPAPVESGPAVWGSDGTVLITGGTGGLGRVVARHLVAEHGVRSLLLVSRSGPAAEGVEELVAELKEQGAAVAVESCDVTDQAAVAELVGRHPVSAVVHTAGVLDDGVIGSLTPERLSAVLRPKVDAAWNLHRATEHLGLHTFVTFSSAAGTFGNPGQANYAAGNAFLDALAQYRRAAGLPAASLAWGPWTKDSGMTGALQDAAAQRIARSGMPELSPEEGVALFDAALTTAEAVVLPVRLDLAALRAQGEIHPLLRGLIRTSARRSATAGSGAGAAAAAELAQRLSALSVAERHDVLLDVVRGQIAVVLGHAGAETVDPERAFQDLGFDSLTSVELRNRLSALTGVRLPATLLFDYPTPAELVDHLYGLVVPEEPSGPESLLSDLDRLEKAFGELEVDEEAHEQIAGRLEVLKAKWSALRKDARAEDDFDFDSASDEEVFDLLDNELGLS